jgi:hypothetical protein
MQEQIDAFGMEFAEEDLLPLARGWCAREAGSSAPIRGRTSQSPLPGRIKPTALLSFLSAAASSSRLLLFPLPGLKVAAPLQLSSQAASSIGV